MIPIIKYALFFCLFLITVSQSNVAYASHGAGAELSFQWLHDSTYQLFYKFYRDCVGVQETDTVHVCYSNTCDTTSGMIPLYKASTVGNGSEVSPPCPGHNSTCTQPGSTIPGYIEWLYTGYVTLPSRCDHWIFNTSIITRNASITNIINPGGQRLYTEATLDNLDAQGDTSPFFSTKPVPFVCEGIPATFNCGAYDANNDSLVYTMIMPQTSSDYDPNCPGTNTNTVFATTTPPFNLTSNPFATNNTFSLNSTTGIMAFTASGIQRGAITLRVDEYRNQIKIGSVMEDIQVIALTCNVLSTTTEILNVQGGVFSTTPDNNIIAHAGTNLSFKILAYVPSSNYNVLITSDNATSIPGSSFTAPPYYLSSDTGIFSWTPSLSDTGDHYVVFSIQDSCNSSLPYPVTFF